jgi:hypothetical protein
MDSRPWHEELRNELRGRGLPAAYIDRLVGELADHALDLQTEDTSMEAQQANERLGTTEQVAVAASREFHRRTFANRYPVLTFILGPVAAVPTLFILILLVAYGIAWIVGSTLELVAGGRVPQFSEQTEAQVAAWFVACFDGYTRFVPFALTAWIFCRWGRRASMRRWAFAACGIVAVMAGLILTRSTPGTGREPGLYMLGLTFHPNVRQLMQIVVPLAVGGWCLLRVPRSSRPTRVEASFLPETLQQA